MAAAKPPPQGGAPKEATQHRYVMPALLSFQPTTK